MKKIIQAMMMVFFLTNISYAPSVKSEPLSTVSAGLAAREVINHFREMIETSIDQAQRAGDFLLWRAAIQIRDSLDAWEASNSALINEVFSSLEAERQALIRDIDRFFSEGAFEIGMTVERSARIVDQVTQVAESSIAGSWTPWVASFTPRVVFPAGSDDVRMIVRGPNLAKASVVATSPIHGALTSSNSSEFELITTLDRNLLPFDESKLTQYEIKIQMNKDIFSILRPATWFSVWRPERKSYTLPVLLLPHKIANYNVSVTRRVSVEQRDLQDIIVGPFVGRNREVDINVQVRDPESGWRIDMDRVGDIRTFTHDANAGHCQGRNIRDHTITRNGLTVWARVDNRDRGLSRRDGWVYCRLHLPVHRFITSDIDEDVEAGELRWTATKEIALPPDTVATRIRMKSFDGVDAIYGGSTSNPPKYYDIRVDNRRVLISARPPIDF